MYVDIQKGLSFILMYANLLGTGCKQKSNHFIGVIRFRISGEVSNPYE